MNDEELICPTCNNCFVGLDYCPDCNEELEEEGTGIKASELEGDNE